LGKAPGVEEKTPGGDTKAFNPPKKGGLGHPPLFKGGFKGPPPRKGGAPKIS